MPVGNMQKEGGLASIIVCVPAIASPYTSAETMTVRAPTDPQKVAAHREGEDALGRLDPGSFLGLLHGNGHALGPAPAILVQGSGVHSSVLTILDCWCDTNACSSGAAWIQATRSLIQPHNLDDLSCCCSWSGCI